MARLNNRNTNAKSKVAIKATDSVGANHKGALGSIKTPKSELFLLGVSSFNEDKFYETVCETNKRIAVLTDAVLKEADGPTWLYDFVKYLRSTANMRTISIVIALETASNMLKAGIPGGRQIVNVALQRADEPGEAIAYWHSKYGRKIPAAVKRGIADAVVRLYNEYSVLKYDSASNAYRFADVIQLVHPNPQDATQSAVFNLALNRRYGNNSSIELLSKSEARSGVTGTELRDMANEGTLTAYVRKAGLTWESVSGRIVGGMDAKVWEQLIPTMGYMATLRNLRNFIEAGVSVEVLDSVAKRISDKDQVAKSKQLPFRFYSAYKATSSSDQFKLAIGRAFDASVQNVPSLPGRTLVLVDMSGSMYWDHSKHSGANLAETAALFGVAVAQRADNANLVTFGTTSREHKFSSTESSLSLVNRIDSGLGGTDINAALDLHFNGQDRVIVITDDQYSAPLKTDGKTPFYIWNLAGYRVGSKTDSNITYIGGGLSDASFKTVPLIEAARDSNWPWEQ